MLSKPEYGWTAFQLEGSGVYWLSYLVELPLNWVDKAIRGLETLDPFCVNGNLEPERFLCTVSYWNCHIIIEDYGRSPLEREDVVHEFSHTNMIEFCRNLYDDITLHFEDWVPFVRHDPEYDDLTERRITLSKRLERLKELISENEEHFGENRFFF
ncbi:MAG: hypothetical protein GX222_00040 [Ruminococcaceae bacterium]|nr:hypothetical protein [Oscillospiraceae bacterium]